MGKFEEERECEGEENENDESREGRGKELQNEGGSGAFSKQMYIVSFCLLQVILGSVRANTTL